MRFHDSDDYDRARRLNVLHTGPRLTRAEGRAIFRDMVRAECRNGALSPQRRRKLIQYAAALKLNPLEAGQIVTRVSREVAEEFNHDVPALYRVVEAAAAPHRWPMWVKASLVLVATFVVDRLVRQMF